MIGQAMKEGSMLVPGWMSYRHALSALWLDESGQDMLEFALVAALLSLCAVASLQTLSSKVTLLWAGLANSFNESI